MHALKQGLTLGQYEIIRLLGEGGMGAVYEARHTSLDRRVAIKTLHSHIAANQTTLLRFFAEAKTLSRLEHPSIVQVSDFGTSPDGTAYLVMEYLRGDSLGKRLRKFHDQGQTFSVVQAIQICWQVAEVLTIAHSKGIVHRDIKPDNLMLVADAVAPSGERVKVLDFGIAKLSGDFERGVAKTDTNALMGTPMYMSPEQCAGAGKVDDRTDVYALGCVFFQMLAGRPPFYAEGAGELIGMHLFQAPPPLVELCPGLPKSVATLVGKMLTKDKSQRPNMSLVAEELRQLVAQQAGQSCLVPTPVRTPDDEIASSVQGVPLTTMGQSAGQNTAVEQRKRLSLLVGGALALLVLGGIATTWMIYPVGKVLHVAPRDQPALDIQATLPGDRSASAEATRAGIPKAGAAGPKDSALRLAEDRSASGSSVSFSAGNQEARAPIGAETEPGQGSLSAEFSQNRRETESLSQRPKAVTSPSKLGPRTVKPKIRVSPKADNKLEQEPSRLEPPVKKEIRYED